MHDALLADRSGRIQFITTGLLEIADDLGRVSHFGPIAIDDVW